MRSLGKLFLLALPFAVSAYSQNCSLSANPQNLTVPAAGGAQTFAVTLSNSACFWYVSGGSGSPWIVQTSPTNGQFGNGTVAFTVAQNPGAGRNASIGLVLFGNPAIKYQVQILQSGSSSPQPFADVPPSSAFFDYVNILQKSGVTIGCQATQVTIFCPDSNLTRAQAAASIVRSLVTEPFIYTRTPYFTDVPATSPFFSYIQKLKDLGITSGCQATPALFCPEAFITRGQMATLMIRGKFGAGATLNAQQVPYFTDVPATNVNFSFIQKMKDYGITAGCSTTQYCPDQTMTRGMMAVLMSRLFLTPFLF